MNTAAHRESLAGQYEIMRASDWSAIVQAAAAVVTVCVTIVLVWITRRYVRASEATLRVLQDERSDRISASKAPAVNALVGVEDILLELARELSNPQLGDLYRLRERVGMIVNEVSRASQLLAFGPLTRNLQRLASEIQTLWSLLPRQPGQDQPKHVLGDVIPAPELVEERVAAIRSRVAEVEATLRDFRG